MRILGLRCGVVEIFAFFGCLPVIGWFFRFCGLVMYGLCIVLVSARVTIRNNNNNNNNAHFWLVQQCAGFSMLVSTPLMGGREDV
jgi:hypothetical protein